MNPFVQFFEKLFYNPSFLHRVVAFLLLPISLLYAFIVLIRRLLAKPVDFSIPIISVGNLTIGGSGKTPFIIQLCNRYKGACVISRGYGRDSKGMHLVSKKGKLLLDVKQAGDEAVLIATQTQADVIVSEDRTAAIEYAKKELAPSVILLDDGFSKVDILKYELLLYPQKLPNYLPLPSGPFREFFFCSYFADMILQEGRDFTRKVKIKNPTKKMVLVTAIANPSRLDPYLPSEVISKHYYSDHAYFDPKEVQMLLQHFEADSILVTQKDLVKIDFKIPLSVMELTLEIAPSHLQTLDKQLL